VFRSSSSDVSDFTDVVTNFIATLEDTTVPTVKVISFPWVDGSIRAALNAPTAVYSGLVSGHMDIQSGRQQWGGCKEELQRQSGGADGAAQHQMPMARATNYHRTPSAVSADASLADDLNSFYVSLRRGTTLLAGP